MARWHGLRKKFRAEYVAWNHMKRRCYDPKNPDWTLYGGRGVTVCPQWRASFPAFLADLGPKPNARLTLDRRDPNGNYEPGNCRWATRQQQAANRRYCRKVKVRGRQMTIEEAARLLRVPPMTFRCRIYRGMGVKAASSRHRLPRRDSSILTHQGKTMTLPEWALKLGLRVRTLRERLRRAMPLDKALTRGLLRAGTA